MDKSAKKAIKMEISWETLENIAHYYQFPVAVFCQPKSHWEKYIHTTRIQGMQKIVDKYYAIQRIIEGGSDDD